MRNGNKSTNKPTSGHVRDLLPPAADVVVVMLDEMAPEVHDARWHGERNPAHQTYTQGRTPIRDRPLG